MFSQPMGTGSSRSSSVAAMLGDLMCRNRCGLVPGPLSEPREIGRSTGPHDSLSSETYVTSFDKADSPRCSGSVVDGESAAGSRELTSSTATVQMLSDTVSASQLCSEAQMSNCLSYPSNSSSWSK